MHIWKSGDPVPCDGSLAIRRYCFFPPGAKIPELHVPMRKRTAKEEKKKRCGKFSFFLGSVSLKRLTMVGWKVAKA